MQQALRAGQAGVSLVEVLVTMVILAIGLLGLVGLQARLQILQGEAYQRAQALMLLKDITGRIANNRNNAAAYVTGAANPIGEDACPTDVSTRRNADIAEWCNLLQGASEETDTEARVGAMVGGRGCVEDLDDDPGGGPYLVTVAWQGLAPIAAPPASVACGFGQYDGGTVCVDDLCRRAVTSIVRIADLTETP
jgi:type IV pilus assembly protein PilV